MTKSLYLFDDKQKVIKIIAEKHLTELVQREELNEDGSLPVDRLTASFVVTAYKEYLNPVYMAVKDLHEPNSFHMYYINQPTLNGDTVRYEGVQLGYHELKYEINRDYRPQNRTALEMYTQVLKDTEWRVGYVSDDGSQTTNFYYQPALDSIQQIANLFGQDIVFKVEISGNKITDKWLESYSQRGSKTMKRFAHGSNALTIEQSVERGDIYTALIGRGKGEETDNGGYGRRIQFDDVVWRKSNGNPVDKPAGQDYVEIPESTSLYGILNADGTKKPRIGVIEFQDIEDENELIQETYNSLINLSRPLVQYKSTISDIGNVQLGETVTIHRFDLGIHYQTRVFKIERNYLNVARTPVSLGDVLIQNRAKREASLNKTVNNLVNEQELIKQEVSYVVQTADGFNTITYGNTEPERKRVGDSWVRDDPVHEGFTEWLIWNGTAWDLTISQWQSEQLRLEIQEIIAQAETDRADAEQKFNQAVSDSKAYSEAKAAELTGEINTVKTEVTNTVNDAVTQLDNAINLRVQKGDVVGQINVEAGQTLIQNNKILLDGNTYTIGTTFANDIKAKSLDAVRADIADLRTLMLTANTVTSTMIKSDTALIDKLFATDANVNKLTAKTAFINAVKATDITADRVTGGTFNGSKMNIINLNADSITTGTMQGRNLSINLNTGEVLFQKGIIKRSDGKFNIDVTKGRLESYDAIGGITLENGSLKLYKKPLLLEVQSREDMYGSIDYENSFFSGRGMTLTGNQGVMMKTMDYFANWVGRPSGSAIFMRNKRINIESENGIFIQGGEKVPSGAIFDTPPEIAVGVSIDNAAKPGSAINIDSSALRIDIEETFPWFLFSKYGFFVKGVFDTLEYDIFGVKPYDGDPLKESNFEFRFGGANDFRFGHDGSGDKLVSKAVYNRTIGNAANMFVTSYGTIARSTSASKYKLNISEIPDIDNYAERVLTLKPKQWFDKETTELYAREQELGHSLSDEQQPITPFYGLIAEDVADAGLERYVQYGADGKEIEGIMYDRLWTLLIPIVKRQKEDIAKLKNKISEMENAI